MVMFPQPLTRLQHLNDDCVVDSSGSATVRTVDPTVCLRSRLAAAVDAFMLKILTEQELGFPTELVQDGDSLEIASNLRDLASIYQALESGAVHMYPEVARDIFTAPRLVRSSLQSPLQLWRLEVPALYEAYVLNARSVPACSPTSPSPLDSGPNHVSCFCRWCRQAR